MTPLRCQTAALRSGTPDEKTVTPFYYRLRFDIDTRRRLSSWFDGLKLAIPYQSID
jgi:hypothetical protein